MSTDHASILGQTDLAVNDSKGEFHLGLCNSGTQGPNTDADVPLPRPERRPRRAKADRGLPPDEELANLARACLDRQGKHWPEMAQAGLLPLPTECVIGRMVEDFKKRHRGGKVDVEAIPRFRKVLLEVRRELQSLFVR